MLSSFAVLDRLTEFPELTNPGLIWKSWTELTDKPDRSWSDWLLAAGSLTQILVKKSENQFAVKLIAEEWLLLPATDLRGQFGPLADSHKFWSRKVILQGRGIDWVMAHTLVPEHSFLSPLKEILTLQTSPLGEYLFSHPDLIRGAIELVGISKDCWGRRSHFFLFGKPIMVAEFFLPQLIDS
jgi:chorismate--pyruvate lyase